MKHTNFVILSCAIATFVVFSNGAETKGQLKELKRFQNKIIYAYVYPNQDMTGREAKAACDQEGLTLAAIDNQAENEVVGSFLRQRVRSGEDNNRAWLGGSDTGKENRWYWMHSKQPLTFTNWAEGHPIKSNLYNCMFMDPPKKDRNGFWYSEFCTEVAQGVPICQKLL